MSYLLFLGTSLISWIPAILLICITILPYTFVTGMFLYSIFFQVISFMFSALFWLAYQRFDSSVSYMMGLATYIFFTNGLRISFYDRYKTAKNRFFTVGANVSLHATHPYHVGYASGLAWGFAEALCFYGSHLFAQFGGLSQNAVIYPSIYTQCGQFTPKYIPFPTVFGTSIQFLCVVIINICLSFLAVVVRTWFSTSRQRPNICLTFFLNIIIYLLHFAFYLVPYFTRSQGLCNTALNIPPSMTIFILLVTYFFYRSLHTPKIQPQQTNSTTTTPFLHIPNQTAQESISFLRSRIRRTGTNAHVDGHDDERPVFGDYNQFHDNESEALNSTQNHNPTSTTQTTTTQRLHTDLNDLDTNNDYERHDNHNNYQYQQLPPQQLSSTTRNIPINSDDHGHNYNFENDYGDYSTPTHSNIHSVASSHNSNR